MTPFIALLFLGVCFGFAQQDDHRGSHLVSKSGKSMMPFRHRKGDKNGLRVLMVSVDNRELNPDIDAGILYTRIFYISDLCIYKL